jgi:ComF family protein
MARGFGGLVLSSAVAAAGLAARALFPHHCAGCGQEGDTLCPACRPAIETPRAGFFVCPGCGAPARPGMRCGAAACATGPLDSLAAAAAYAEAPLRRLMQEYKYARVEAAGESLCRVLIGSVRAHGGRHAALAAGAIVAPIPLHPLKRAERGFNQAESFARAYARITGRPLAPRLLRRLGGGPAQATLDDPIDRAANAAGKFAVRLRLRPGAAIVLVDDVATTGATLRDAARALKTAGAAAVHAVTVLRG